MLVCFTEDSAKKHTRLEGSVGCDQTTAGERPKAAAAQSLFWLVSERFLALRPVLGSAPLPSALLA